MKAFLRSVGMVSLLRMAVEMLQLTGATRRMCQTLLGLMTCGLPKRWKRFYRCRPAACWCWKWRNELEAKAFPGLHDGIAAVRCA